jgi:DNA primase
MSRRVKHVAQAVRRAVAEGMPTAFWKSYLKHKRTAEAYWRNNSEARHTADEYEAYVMARCEHQRRAGRSPALRVFLNEPFTPGIEP